MRALYLPHPRTAIDIASWIPAFAGMTKINSQASPETVIPAQAGIQPFPSARSSIPRPSRNRATFSSPIAVLGMLILLALPGRGQAEQFKLYLDETYQGFIMVDKQDCAIHRSEDRGITLGLKIGNILVNAGPEITFGKKDGIDWDRTVQVFISRYQELCTRFNTGSLTKSEYDKRLAEIERIDKEAYELHKKYLLEKEKHKQEVFDEMDKDDSGLPDIKQEHDRINGHLDDLGRF